MSEQNKVKENQLQLTNLLKTLLEKEQSIELYGSWAGDDDKLESSKIISVNELLENEFYFEEKELLTVKIL